MAFFPKPTARAIVVAAVFFTLFWRTDPAMPELIRKVPEPVPNAKSELSAGEILARMAVVYAECDSYQDEGVVWNEFSGFIGHESSRPFATTFVRGGGFRFEYRTEGRRSLVRLFDEDDRTVIWGTERRARSWSSAHGGDEASLGHQLGGEAGVSGGASAMIPRLLSPGILQGRRITELAEPTLVAIEALDGRNCFRVEAGRSSFRETMWIDAETFLLRRMQDTTELSGGTTCVSTTAYSPRVNVEIDPAVFAFEPPQ